MKRIKLVFALLWVFCMGAWAAPNALYFMDILPFQAYQNPALRPLSNTYVEIPGISSISASAGLGNLSLNDIMYVKEGKLVTFLHPEYGNKDALFAKLRSSNYVTADVDVSLLGFGFAVKERGYFTFNTSVRTDVLGCLPKDLVSLGLYGTPDTLGVNRYDLGSTRINARAYIDIAGGYSHRINDQWTVGGRLHLLVGAAAAEASFDELYLEASQDVWNLKGKGQVNVSMPGLSVTTDEEGGIDKITMNADANAILSSYKPSMGAAIDLGVAYKPLPELTVSLSLKDIGFMYWNNLNTASGDIAGSFKGVYFDFEEPLNIADSLLSAIKGSYRVGNQTGYVQEMKGKLYVGAEYSFLRNMMSVGVLSKTEFMSNYVTEEVSLNYKIRPCHWFGISAGYSFVSGGWSTIGFGMDIKLPPFNFYVATDYTPLHYSAQGIPYKSQAVNVQAGVVLTFKTKDNTKRLTAKAEDLSAIPEVAAEEPAAEPQADPEPAVPEPVEGSAAPANTLNTATNEWDALVAEAGTDASSSVTTVTESTSQQETTVAGAEVGGTETVKLSEAKEK